MGDRCFHLLSLLPIERGSALADFLEPHFKTAKLLRAQFREHFPHLPGMLSKGRNNEILATRGEGNDPNASIFGALDPADQSLRDEAIDRDTDRARACRWRGGACLSSGVIWKDVLRSCPYAGSKSITFN